MKATIEDYKSVKPGSHTLHESPQYAAQLAGGGLFFQVMSGLTENPIRIILHDRFSGQRKLLTIECDSPTRRASDPPVQQVVKSVQLSKNAPPSPPVSPVLKSVPTHQVAPKVAPAPKAVPTVAVSVASTPTVSKAVQVAKATFGDAIDKVTIAPPKTPVPKLFTGSLKK
jgi:hypothetical protein